MSPVIPDAIVDMMKKEKECKDCDTSLVELVSVKEPDMITLVCFNCGVIVESYNKREMYGEDIEIDEE